ncbi:MAG: hypothetical protein R3Y63_05635 [Eubacteriales bacterium]
MDLQKVKTAPNSSIGVDEGQSIKINTKIITAPEEKSKPYVGKFSEFFYNKEEQCFETMTLSQLYDQNFP